MAFLFCAPSGFCDKLILSLAEKVFLPLPDNSKVHIGDKSLVTLQAEQGQLSLLTRKKGYTLLVAGNTKYEIFIFDKEKKLQALKLNQLLKNFWGLSWSVSGNNSFQVTGKLNRLHDWADLAGISKTYNIPYEFKALPGEGLEQLILHYFKNLFPKQAPLVFNWLTLPLVYVPQGADLLNYQKLLQPFGLKPKEDPLSFFKAPFIEIEIALVENLSSSGFSFGGNTDSKNPLSRFSSLLSFLNFLKKSGQGKTLHHSSIIAQSGQKLQIHSGGQIPFNSYNLKTEQASTRWKSHGFHLNITPRAGKNNNIELTIQARLSEPLAFSSIDSPPPLKTQSLENKVVLKEGEILKLLQLQKESQGTQNQGRLGFLLNAPFSFLSGNNKYDIAQFVFIQAQTKEKKKGTALFKPSICFNFPLIK